MKEDATPKAEELAAAKPRHGVAAVLAPFQSLSNRNFRYLWLGQLGSASAMWAEAVARNWLTWEMTNSGLALGLVNLFRAVPLLVVGLWGGVAADRFDKRKLLIVIQTWSLLFYILMAVLIEKDWIRLWHIYFTATALGMGMAVNQPVRTSFIPQIVDKRQLINALSLNSIAINVSRLIGPALIGLLIAFAGVGPAYIVSAALYCLVILSTYMLQPGAQPDRKGRKSMGRELVEGFRFMLRERVVLALVVLALGPLGFAFSYTTLLPVFSTEVLHWGATGFGSLQSVSAVGALVGGLTLASRGNIPHKSFLMLGSGLGYGLLIMALGGVQFAALAFLVIALVGACQTIFRAANNSTLLEITPAHLQGRIISVTLLDRGIQPLASVVAGLLVDLANVSMAMVFIGGVCVLIVAAIALMEPKLRHL